MLGNTEKKIQWKMDIIKSYLRGSYCVSLYYSCYANFFFDDIVNNNTGSLIKKQIPTGMPRFLSCQFNMNF